MASAFNSSLINQREIRGPFYFDTNTQTIGVLPSLVKDVEITEQFLEKHRSIQNTLYQDFWKKQSKWIENEAQIRLPRPRKPPTAFLLYFQKVKSTAPEVLQKFELGQKAKEVAALWNALLQEEKDVYLNEARRLTQHFKTELLLYESRLALLKKELERDLSGHVELPPSTHLDLFGDRPEYLLDPKKLEKYETTALDLTVPAICVLCSNTVDRTNTDFLE